VHKNSGFNVNFIFFFQGTSHTLYLWPHSLEDLILWVLLLHWIGLFMHASIHQCPICTFDLSSSWKLSFSQSLAFLLPAHSFRYLPLSTHSHHKSKVWRSYNISSSKLPRSLIHTLAFLIQARSLMYSQLQNKPLGLRGILLPPPSVHGSFVHHQ